MSDETNTIRDALGNERLNKDDKPPVEYTSKMCHVTKYNDQGLVRCVDGTIYANQGAGVRRVEIVDGKICGVKRRVSKKERRRLRQQEKAEAQRNVMKSEQNEGENDAN